MPDADSNRKRSRSPSDSEPPKQHKRANTGNTTNTATNNDSTTSTNRNNKSADSLAPSASMTHDVTMSDEPASALASTPSPKRSPTDTKQVQDSASNAGDTEKPGKSSASAPPSSSTSTSAPSAMIHMRCLIVTQDASIIIGKGGSHVNEIREKSGARVMVSESIPGNPERILNVSGPLDAVSKVSENLKKRTLCHVLYLISRSTGFWSDRPAYQ